MPMDENLAKKSFLPLGISFTPFADSAPGEAPIPILDLRTTSSSISSDKNGVPLRCERCRAYINPGFKFASSSGSEFVCNLCDATSVTPPEYRSVMNPATGLRADWDSCPEYRCGSIDILVGSQDYCIRPQFCWHCLSGRADVHVSREWIGICGAKRYPLFSKLVLRVATSVYGMQIGVGDFWERSLLL